MSPRPFLALLFLLLAGGVYPGRLSAQSVCASGNGELKSDQPSGIAPAQIIERFAANEAAFQEARERYGFTLGIKVETLDNYGRPEGAYEQNSEVTLNDIGKRVEMTTFAPLSTLRRISLSEDDLDDIRQRLPASVTSADLPRYSVSYVGKQGVDQLETYVFDAVPKNPKKDRKLFQGRLWVDTAEFAIVKTCGKPRQDEGADATKRGAYVNLAPVFVTYREQVDGKFWFVTYARADELQRFPGNFVHIRETVKYSDYKLLPNAH